MKNKKVIICITIIVACVVGILLLFNLLGNKRYGLAIMNAENNIELSLGETRAQIENSLGEHSDTISFLDTKMYYYDGENIGIIYDSNDSAVLIRCVGDNYFTLKDIHIGDDINKIEKIVGNSEEITNKTIYFHADEKKCSIISHDEVNEIIAANGFDNLYVVDFGSSTSDRTVEHIMIATYEAAMGIVK